MYMGFYFLSILVLLSAIVFRERFVAKPLVFQHRFTSSVHCFQRACRLIRQEENGGEKSIMSLSKGKLAAAVSALVCVSLVMGVVIGMTLVQYRISGAGNIQLPPKINVYSDAACTAPVTSVDFGTFAPGDTVNRTIYLRNEGGVTGTYSVATANWNPTIASQFLGLSWDYAGASVSPGTVTKVILHLHASTSLTSETGITNFSFDAIISLEG
jgi:hypothetical protein